MRMRIQFHKHAHLFEVLLSPKRRSKRTFSGQFGLPNFLVSHPSVQRIPTNSECFCSLDRCVQLHRRHLRTLCIESQDKSCVKLKESIYFVEKIRLRNPRFNPLLVLRIAKRPFVRASPYKRRWNTHRSVQECVLGFFSLGGEAWETLW